MYSIESGFCTVCLKHKPRTFIYKGKLVCLECISDVYKQNKVKDESQIGKIPHLWEIIAKELSDISKESIYKQEVPAKKLASRLLRGKPIKLGGEVVTLESFCGKTINGEKFLIDKIIDLD